MLTKTNSFLLGAQPYGDNNSLGHRAKELHELDYNNYILFGGCSITWGTGLNLEETYPYLTSKNLNVDYYNLAIQGGSIDLAVVNIFAFLKNIQQKPKFIVLQYPGPFRFLLSDDLINFKNIGPWVKQIEERDILIDLHKSNYLFTKYYLYEQLVSCISVPVIHVRHENNIDLPKNVKNVLVINQLDVARDKIHAGIQSNKNFASVLTEHIQKLGW